MQSWHFKKNIKGLSRDNLKVGSHGAAPSGFSASLFYPWKGIYYTI